MNHSILKILKKIYVFLKEERLHDTIISFILTLIFVTGGGLWFNSYFQNKLDKRQREYEFFRFQLEKKDYTLNFVSENINLRYLNSKRFISASSSKNIWDEYYYSVIKWNTNLEQMRMNIIKYYGWEVSSELIDENNDSKNDIPKTIHYKFVKLHDLLVDIKNGDSSKISKAIELQEKIIEQKNKLMTLMIENSKADNDSLE